MAPGVCVTSFRMFKRLPDLRHFNRLTPVTTLTVNTWHLRRYSSASEASEAVEGQLSNRKKSHNTNNTNNNNDNNDNNNSNTDSKRRRFARSASDGETLSSQDELIGRAAAAELPHLKVLELKQYLRSFDLSVSGNKPQLVERLSNYLQQYQQQQQQEQQQHALNGHSAPYNPSSERVEAPPAKEIKADDNILLLSCDSVATDALPLRIVDDDKEVTTTTTITTPSSSPSPPTTSSSTTTTTSLITTPSTESATTENSRLSSIHIEDINHSTDHHSANGEVVVEYIQGLPHITVPLPSRSEKCRFSLKPVSQNVGDLIEMLKFEDRGIDRATVLNTSGVRIASTCTIESLMDEPFWLKINNYKYKVVPPERQRIHFEDVSKLGDIRALVAQLYEALHVGEYHIQKEQELKMKLEDLKYRVAPMERVKSELSTQANRKTNMMTWLGLGLMSVQFGILARLTWWEYSWDIMEPVTYFVTYGTAMAMYAYFCITKTDYQLPEVKERQYLIHIHKNAKKKNFDIDSYNTMKRQIAEIEYDLRRLHDPLNLQLPPHVDRAQEHPPRDLPPGCSPTSANKQIESSPTSTLNFSSPKDDKN